MCIPSPSAQTKLEFILQPPPPPPAPPTPVVSTATEKANKEEETPAGFWMQGANQRALFSRKAGAFV